MRETFAKSMISGTSSGAVASYVARLESSEQIAHNIADRVADSFAAEDVAVSLFHAGRNRWHVALHFRAAPDHDAVRAVVARAAGPKAAAKSVQALSFECVAAQDWVRESLAGLEPVAAGRFIVHGAHDRARVAVNRIGIEIEAALAFGTGRHGTTRGCLLALDRLCKSLSRQRPIHRHSEVRATGAPRRMSARAVRILDLGTGSGVLAIAAARALRQRVLATDIDANAVRVARGNIRLNRVGTMVEVVKADGVTAPSLSERAPFDLIFANILLGPLQRIATPLRQRTASGGRIVLSGLLPAQANAVIAAYRPLALERRIELDGWTTLVFVRPARAC